MSPYPAGDYYRYLSEDLLTGRVGHPWEGSLCLFGQGLLDVGSAKIDDILGSAGRRSGQHSRHVARVGGVRSARESGSEEG
ncbi:DUF2716 domain-containing protein [Streptomyces sp. ICC1]|uniref:DUF2716 domain-containing protein n=1 Tax=Streptomyces sp. ICC1 TaxID=2099583 RepID=UPI000DC7B932|nr:DUF2716 domain-containing protein [Streptomyces sp. ICC1]AWZ18599.1 hypothetical protein DRB96_40890 [Streptomyces sp. ICC1]